MSSCEYDLIVNSLLEGVAIKRVHFRFGLEVSDIQIRFRSIFRSLYLFYQDRGKILILYFFCPWIILYC